MDTSPEYIRQCEKAEEIQKVWIPADWDYCYCPEDEAAVVLSGYETDSGFYGHYVAHDYVNGKLVNLRIDGCADGNHIWLPTQAQLQEMLFDKTNDPDTERAEQISQFYHFCMCPYRQQFTSMEQLWLAFVMSERFGKVWLDNKWQERNRS